MPVLPHLEDKVVDSRESKEGDVIRRRRECLSCGKRFTSYERIDQIPHLVVKKDGRRERFDREKVMQGLLKACEKRPVPVKALESIVDGVEAMVQESPDREVPTDQVGEFLMDAAAASSTRWRSSASPRSTATSRTSTSSWRRSRGCSKRGTDARVIHKAVPPVRVNDPMLVHPIWRIWFARPVLSTHPAAGEGSRLGLPPGLVPQQS